MLEVKNVITHLSANHFEWSFKLESGEFMAITGPSGVGKSTMLNVLLGFQPMENGVVSWQGDAIHDLQVNQKPFGVLFQRDNLFDHLTVERNISFGLDPSGKLKESQRQRLIDAANRFQLTQLLGKKCSQLSGGQQQSVALARVFLQNKPILLLDEPFSSLDPELRREGLGWVRELQAQQGTTILMVTHHLPEVQAHTDWVLEGVSSSDWKQYALPKQ
jgi:thiamine transport system ATP-binding protein